MIELLLISSSFFGHGLWECTHSYDYPKDNLKESFVSRVIHKADLTYESEGHVTYRILDTGQMIARASIVASGKTLIEGHEFSIVPSTYNVGIDFDVHQMLTQDYLAHIQKNGLAPGHGLYIKELSDIKMIIEHKKSGDITQCTSYSM